MVRKCKQSHCHYLDFDENKEILTAVPDQYRQWLEEKLKYSNELSLRKRMKELLGRHSDVMSM
jgi:hypothetical protein